MFGWLKSILGKSGKSNRVSTPLHRAVDQGDAAEVRRLLAAGANVHARNADGDTPLRLACYVSIATMLLEKGADVNAANDAGLTPLHKACAVSGTGLVRLYLKHRANVHAAATDGTTPFLTAAIMGNDYQMSLLLRLGADASATNAGGRCALHMARAQTMRDVALVLAAIDVLVAESQWKPQAEELRRRVYAAIDEVVLRDCRSPAALDEPSDPRSSTLAMQEHQAQIGLRTAELRKRRLPAILRSVAEQSPEFSARLDAETSRLSNGA